MPSNLSCEMDKADGGLSAKLSCMRMVDLPISSRRKLVSSPESQESTAYIMHVTDEAMFLVSQWHSISQPHEIRG